MKTLTELTAWADEARPAGALSSDVVTVRSILATTHFSALGAVETRGAACRATHSSILHILLTPRATEGREAARYRPN